MTSSLPAVTANGVRFSYLEDGKGPLVLLLHGFPDTAYTWDATLPALAAAGYRAVAPFMRGYHPTEVPADGSYDIDTLAADAVALIAALGAERAVLIGHDWGASAAYGAAALAPERVRLLVTVAFPHPRGIRPSPRLLWKVRHLLTLRSRRAAARAARNDFATIDELVQRWSPTWNVPAGETDHVKQVFRHPGSLDAALGYYRALRPRLPASHRKPITVPTVAFAPEHDDIVSPRGYEKARHCFQASYEVVQVPGGHFLHRQHPEIFIPELVRVVQRHTATRS